MTYNHDQTFQMRADADFFDKVDRWRRQNGGRGRNMPSRAEAVRQMVEYATRRMEREWEAADDRK